MSHLFLVFTNFCQLAYDVRRGDTMKKKKEFDVAKHLKRLSRSLLRAPQGRPIQSKRPKILQEISRQEIRDSERET
jgi:hypothetical protein